jgi:hypothetical protein
MCNDPTCDLPTVICADGYKGHKIFWLERPLEKLVTHDDKTYYRVRFRIAHAHFVRNVDIGRHCGHTLDEYGWISEDSCNVTVALSTKKPEWLLEDSK